MDAVQTPAAANSAGRLHAHGLRKRYGAGDTAVDALKARLGEGFEFPVSDTMELEARVHRPPPG